jgi:hypothetical protein
VLRVCRVEDAAMMSASGLGLRHGIGLLIAEEVGNMGHSLAELRRLELDSVAGVRRMLSVLRTDFIKFNR